LSTFFVKKKAKCQIIFNKLFLFFLCIISSSYEILGTGNFILKRYEKVTLTGGAKVAEGICVAQNAGSLESYGQALTQGFLKKGQSL